MKLFYWVYLNPSICKITCTLRSLLPLANHVRIVFGEVRRCQRATGTDIADKNGKYSTNRDVERNCY